MRERNYSAAQQIKSFLRLSSYEQKFSDRDLQEYADICFPSAPGLQLLGV